MISRKLMKIGHGSFMITLPKGWIRKNKLKERDLLFLNETVEGEIIVSKHVSHVPTESFVIRLTNEIEKEHLKRVIIGKYIEGYERIEIHGKLSGYSDVIHKLSNFLTGIELMEETPNRIVIDSIIKPSDLPISKVTRRMAYLARVMFQSFFEQSGDVTIFEDSMDRLSFFAHRCINQAVKNPTFARDSKIKIPKLPFYLLVVRRLESIADQIDGLYINSKTCKKSELDKILSFAKDINDIYTKASKAFLNSDKQKAQEVIDLEEKINNTRDELTNYYSRFSTAEYINCINHLHRIFDSVTQMLEAVITYC
jgi:phosphate uptake regulator